MLRDDPSKLNYCGIDGMAGMRNYYYPVENIDTDRYQLAKELLIDSGTEQEANLISGLVHAGCLLAEPSIMKCSNPYPVSLVTESDDDIDRNGAFYEDTFGKNNLIRNNLLHGCYIAMKSFDDERLIYSLQKFRYSLNQSSISLHSTHHHYGQVFYSDRDDYYSHVVEAYAFLSAYSIIEELKIDIKSSKDKNRWVKPKSSQFNPLVKDDIMNRLNEKGIDGEEKIIFVIRGNEKCLFDAVEPQLGVPIDDDSDINRDREMSIIEALHYCSYVRNFIVAHALSSEAKHVSPYDIYNVQMLTRYLLLKCLGVWNKTEIELVLLIRNV